MGTHILFEIDYHRCFCYGKIFPNPQKPVDLNTGFTFVSALSLRGKLRGSFDTHWFFSNNLSAIEIWHLSLKPLFFLLCECVEYVFFEYVYSSPTWNTSKSEIPLFYQAWLKRIHFLLIWSLSCYFLILAFYLWKNVFITNNTHRLSRFCRYVAKPILDIQNTLKVPEPLTWM